MSEQPTTEREVATTAMLVWWLRDAASILAANGSDRHAQLVREAAAKLEQPPEPAADHDTLKRIKDLVCGDAYPRWDNSPQTTATRCHIADLCDWALAPKQPETKDGKQA